MFDLKKVFEVSDGLRELCDTSPELITKEQIEAVEHLSSAANAVLDHVKPDYDKPSGE